MILISAIDCCIARALVYRLPIVAALKEKNPAARVILLSVVLTSVVVAA